MAKTVSTPVKERDNTAVCIVLVPAGRDTSTTPGEMPIAGFADGTTSA